MPFVLDRSHALRKAVRGVFREVPCEGAFSTKAPGGSAAMDGCRDARSREAVPHGDRPHPVPPSSQSRRATAPLSSASRDPGSRHRSHRAVTIRPGPPSPTFDGDRGDLEGGLTPLRRSPHIAEPSVTARLHFTYITYAVDVRWRSICSGVRSSRRRSSHSDHPRT